MLELRKIKPFALKILKQAGVFELVANSHWRSQRLLILCYHGIALEDEHLWRPYLYITPEMLDARLATLRQMGCSVLRLGEGLQRLRSRDLPPRSVAITFDDGTYDFYRQGWPLLRKYGFPATVYQTTYYSDHEMPIFNLMCSYLLWKRRGERGDDLRELGISGPFELNTEQDRRRLTSSLVQLSEREKLSGEAKNELARRLAGILGIDYDLLLRKRMLQLMNAKEVAEIANSGIDVQLHTHRHRTPNDETSFRREIAENRERIEALAGTKANHFCYPSGFYRSQFAGWLEKEQVLSAATCDAGLARRDNNPYRLPRYVDTSLRTQLEFESWLSGVGSMLAFNRIASPQYIRE